MSNRRILTAFVVVTSAIAGLSLYAYLIVGGREEQREADELEILSAIAERRPIDLSGLRIEEAIDRLVRRREIVWVDSAYYLTRAGWARLGKPLSEETVKFLRSWSSGKQVVRGHLSDLDVRNFISHSWSEHRSWLTPAGRAVLDGQASS